MNWVSADATSEMGKIEGKVDIFWKGVVQNPEFSSVMFKNLFNF